MAAESTTAVIAAIGGNLALAVTKFIAAGFSGSSAMLSEGIHSSVDTCDGLLLLWGIHRSKRPPDEEHPFGHGLELYFWTFIVAILIFGVGGGVSVYEGILHLSEPELPTSVYWSFAVLACGFVFEGISWYFAFTAFRSNPSYAGVWSTIRKTKDPTATAVLLEDSAALLGLVVALLGVLAGYLLENRYADGIASIVIGLLLMAVAALLAWESRSLLIGESADREMLASIRRIAASEPEITEIKKPLTMHFGPHQILVNLEVQFRDDLTTGQLERAVKKLEDKIREKHPDVKRIFLEARSIANSRPARGTNGDTAAERQATHGADSQ